MKLLYGWEEYKLFLAWIDVGQKPQACRSLPLLGGLPFADSVSAIINHSRRFAAGSGVLSV